MRLDNGNTEEYVSKGQTTSQKVLLTMCLVLTWICLGLCGEITGPTLKDLKLRAHSDYEDVSRAISGRSAGSFIGAIIGGFLVDKLPRFCNLLIGISLCSEAIVTVIAPYAPQIPLLWLLFTLQGASEGITNLAGQKLILETWLEKASSPMHALHLGFGIGSFIVPEIANPFLAVFVSNEAENNTYYNSTHYPNTTFSTTNPNTMLVTEQTLERDSRIEWPYTIVAAITVAMSFVFFFYQFCNRRSKVSKLEDIEGSVYHGEKEKNQISTVNPGHSNSKTCLSKVKSFANLMDPGTCTGGQRFYGLQVFILLFLHFFTSVGGERLYGKFIRTYAIDELHFNGDDATLINTTFWISFSLGRFAGFVAGRWIPIRKLILIECTGGLITAILLNIFAHDNATLLWVLTQPMGFFIGPLYPSGIAWGDFHVKMTGVGITVLLFGASIGGVSYMWLIGYLYDNYGYRSFMYQVLAYGICSVLILYILHFSTWGSSGRFANKEKQVDDQTNKIENSKNAVIHL